MHFHSCKKSIALLMVLMLMFNFVVIFSGNFLCSAVSGEGDIITVDDDGDKDYTSIQDAIDAANAGDIIHIYPGLYQENIVVDKPLVLMGVPGEDLPVIAPAESTDTTMTLTADGCTLDSLKINGCEGYLKAAIKILSNNNLLQNNVILNSSFYGINLHKAHNNDLVENVIEDNRWGIKLEYSYRNSIDQNEIRENWAGVWLHFSRNNLISANDLHENYYGVVLMYKSNKNTIQNNTMTNNGYGIDSFKGDYNIIQENLIQYSKIDGIRLWMCVYNKIRGNTIADSCSHGIQIYFGRIHIIEGNAILRNNIGIFVRNFDYLHTIKHNNFIENNISATFHDSRLNRWIENYWDDWSGSGPYAIHGEIAIKKIGKIIVIREGGVRPWVVYDRRPLSEPYQE
jgi:nitrous oxidase accessory protein